MEEFRRRILKVEERRTHKIKNSIGVYDIYKDIRRKGWIDTGQPVTEHQFYYIIRRINTLLSEGLLNYKDITLPNKMGRLEVRKYNVSIKIKDNKIVTNLPIDWDRTLKLWSEDEEAYKNKQLVKMEEKEVFRVFYNRSKADFNNKSFFEFRINRELKKKLNRRIKRGGFDAFLLNG